MTLSLFRFFRLSFVVLLLSLGSSLSWSSGNDAIGIININTAPAEELAAALNGVGGKKAKAIVEYRRKNGPFTSIDSLSEVKGIGDKTVEKNRSRMTLGE